MSNDRKIKVKDPIKVRFKNTSKGKSVYFDICRDGKREYEFLQLYIMPERTPTDKQNNKETMQQVQKLKGQRLAELQSRPANITIRSKTNVIEYVKAIAEKKRIAAGGGKRTGSANYLALARQIEDYSGTKTTFKNIDKKYCTGFIEHLKTAKSRNDSNKKLSTNTQSNYVKLFVVVLKYAINDNLIANNPFQLINKEDKPKTRQKEIVYVTEAQIEKLAKAPCLNNDVKLAFLFSCWTGLRYSDVNELTWGELKKINEKTYIEYIVNKTKKPSYQLVLPLALEYLPERGDAGDNDRIYKLPSGGYTNYALKSWAFVAGIDTHLTYHVSRRSCATNMLTRGVPIEIVSQVLRHENIGITQRAYGVFDTQRVDNELNKAFGLA